MSLVLWELDAIRSCWIQNTVFSYKFSGNGTKRGRVSTAPAFFLCVPVLRADDNKMHDTGFAGQGT